MPHVAADPRRFKRLLKRMRLCAMIPRYPTQTKTSMAEPVIRFTKVDKRFGQSQVLRGVEFDIARGE
ncbi:MAG: hypothetical protein NT115_18330, partial [Proteobacteria bacterium]|nr:hypothetical protein [Pseudomonadota bacterium]